MSERKLLISNELKKCGHLDLNQGPRVMSRLGGETVVVFGCGPVGIMANKAAWLKGAGRVIGIVYWIIVIFSYFFMVKASLKYLKKKKNIIINTTSVTAYRGSERLLDYSSTKRAIVAFTRSLALSLVEQGIRVNRVAPGPIWIPLIVSAFTLQKDRNFWFRRSYEKSWRASRSGILFCFSRFCRLLLHDRSNSSSQWWRNCERLNSSN